MERVKRIVNFLMTSKVFFMFVFMTLICTKKVMADCTGYDPCPGDAWASPSAAYQIWQDLQGFYSDIVNVLSYLGW